MLVYDTFLFFNEFDCLDIRLHELSEVVDRFVLLEATRTFSNKPKPLYFQEYTGNRFDEFRNRIDVITLDDFRDVDVGDPWAIEARHRDYLFSRLICEPGALVMLSDADEIPSAEFVQEAAEILLTQPACVFRGSQWLCWYWLNCVRTDRWTAGTRIGNRTALQWYHLLGERLRKHDCPIIHGGWHFAYLGDIALKLRSFAHTELDRPPYNTPEHIARCKRECIDLFDNQPARHGPMTIREDLSFLPKYVQDNQGLFRELIHAGS